MSRLTTRQAWAVVLVVLSISVLAILFTVRHLHFLTGRSELLSQHKRFLQLNDEYGDEFQGLHQLIVVVEGPDLDTAEAFVRDLAGVLRRDHEHVNDVFDRIDSSSLEGRKLLLLPPKDLLTLKNHVEEYHDLIKDLSSAPGLNTLFAAINHKISSVMVSHLVQGLLGTEEREGQGQEQKQPLSLSFLISLLEQMDSSLHGDPFHYRSPWADFFGNDKLSSGGFLVSDDNRLVFLLAEPRKQGEGFNAYKDSIRAIRKHIAELERTFPGVRAGVTGEKALNNDEMQSAQSDSSVATVLSMIGVAGLYLLFFRSGRRMGMLVATVVVDLCWTLGLATLIVGHLSILSIFVGPILIGLADDRVVYFLSRYEEERDLGRSFEEAVHRTFLHAGPGIAVAATTNALAFYAMLLADFRGIQELGLIVGNGMLVSCVTTLTFLPALLALAERKKRWERSVRVDFWLARGFRRWGGLVDTRRSQVLALAAVLTLLSALVVPKLRFDYDLLHLQARGTESVTWELKIIEHQGQSSWFALATASSPAAAASKAERFKSLSSVEGVDSIASLVPEHQGERIRLVREIAPYLQGLKPKLAPPAPVRVDLLVRTLQSMRFKLQGENTPWEAGRKPPEREIREARDLAAKVLGDLTSLSPEEAARRLERLQAPLFHDLADKWSLLFSNLDPAGPITLDDIPARLRSRFVSRDGRRFLLQIYPRKDIWEWGPLTEFVTQLRRVDPDVTGSPVVGYEAIRAMKKGYLQGGAYAAGTIFTVAFLTMRSVGGTLLSVLPVLLGMLWTAGLMWLIKLEFNLANLVALPITISIGVESGIYLVRRSREKAYEVRELVGGSTGQAVALFSLSTMVGFGSLMVARYYGIFSMGLLLTLAVGSVLLVSLTVLPLLLLRSRESGTFPADRPAEPFSHEPVE